MDESKLKSYAYARMLPVFFMLFLLLDIAGSVSHSFGSLYKDGYAKRMEINTRNVFEKPGIFLKYEDMEKLKKRFPSGKVSFMSETNSTAGAGILSMDVKQVLAGEDLELFLDLEMCGGIFINADQHKYGRKTAVVSEALAEKLFGSLNVIGNEIDIGGVKHKITGLYRSRTSLITLFGSDGMERVYVPFESLSGSETLPVDTVFIKDPDQEKGKFRKEDMEDFLKEGLKVDLAAYKVTDFYDSAEAVSQPLSMLAFIVGILCILILIGKLSGILKQGFGAISERSRDMYFIEMLAGGKRHVVKYMLPALAMLGLIGLILLGIRFRLYIPYKYIPLDNIFDFGFYMDIIRQEIYEAGGAAHGYAPTALETAKGNSLAINVFIVFLSAAAFISALSAAKLFKITGGHPGKMFFAAAVSVLAAVAVSFALSLVFGLRFALPVKEEAVTVLFILLKFPDGYGHILNDLKRTVHL